MGGHRKSTISIAVQYPRFRRLTKCNEPSSPVAKSKLNILFNEFEEIQIIHETKISASEMGIQVRRLERYGRVCVVGAQIGLPFGVISSNDGFGASVVLVVVVKDFVGIVVRRQV